MTRHTETPSPRRRGRDDDALTPIPTYDGDLEERDGLVARLVASVVPAGRRDAAQRVVDRAVGTLSSNASIVQIVGGGGVLLSVLYTLLHGFFGWFPEGRYWEALSELRSLEVEHRETEAELARMRAAWSDCLDGDASGGEEPR